MAVQLPRSVFEFQRLTLAARARLNDPTIGTEVENGLVRVVSVTYPPSRRGYADVKPLSGWLPQSEAMKFLQTMQ